MSFRSYQWVLSIFQSESFGYCAFTHNMYTKYVPPAFKIRTGVLCGRQNLHVKIPYQNSIRFSSVHCFFVLSKHFFLVALIGINLKMPHRRFHVNLYFKILMFQFNFYMSNFNIPACIKYLVLAFGFLCDT